EIGNEGELCRRAATAIAKGAVLGWVQGRMECGPRALGKRSILCDPRRADMRLFSTRRSKGGSRFAPLLHRCSPKPSTNGSKRTIPLHLVTLRRSYLNIWPMTSTSAFSRANFTQFTFPGAPDRG